MRRRRSEQAVNLFAFQDIITGVAGVMLFILLLLVVQLSLRLATQAAEMQAELTVDPSVARASTTPPAELVEDPAQDLIALQNELKNLRRDNQALLDATERDLDAEIQAAQSELAEIVRRAEATKSQAEQLQQQVAAGEMSDERKQILELRERLREQLDSLKQEQVLHRSGKLVAFKTTATPSRPMWVVDLRDTYAELFDVLDPGDVTAVSYDRNQLPMMVVRQIRDVLSEKTKTQSIILVLRPSVAGAGAVFLSEFRDAGFHLALELLDEDSQITAQGSVPVRADAQGDAP
ncbi:hypothetical protein Mal15_53200 [Stieleria maiorica]|uniref:Uncharacterized protein n=1 Tax=Stieleria maiorica TaxID=2795974 RepID=A0A5B9MK36_9BACT|nr:hypothetical protein [Stieleria maiorica]QEG01244.1 hypothetical protein Mal15_53200 [Stieleria maiorica]